MSKTLKISVVLCTHNPRLDYLNRVLDSLREQTLPKNAWELVIVDNHCQPALGELQDVRWLEGTQFVSEEKLGLLHARKKGFKASKGDLLVFVDDDNVLESDYLENVVSLVEKKPKVGVWSANIDPEFEKELPGHLRGYLGYLAVRTVAQEQLEGNENLNCVVTKCPTLPCGAGMVVQRVVLENYFKKVFKDPVRSQLGRRGNSLLAAEDTDIGLSAWEIGYQTGLTPELSLKHLISKNRISETYLSQLAENVEYSFSLLDLSRKHVVANYFELIKMYLKQGMSYVPNTSQQKLMRCQMKGKIKAFQAFLSGKDMASFHSEPTVKKAVKSNNVNSPEEDYSEYLKEGQVCTFDVYDTLMMRTYGSPQALFYFLGKNLNEKGILTIDPASFVSKRLRAEKVAHQLLDGLSATLDEIYEQFKEILECSDETLRLVRESELQFEEQCLIKMTQYEALIKTLHDRGKCVYFLSDMYLSSDQIQSFLEKAEFFKPGDKIYVSCEHRAFKRAGDLFKKFLEQEKMEAKKVTHFGNHKKADVEGAKSVGVKSVFSDRGNFNRYEKLMDEKTEETKGLSALMAGASRMTRTLMPTTSENQACIRDVSCGVAAPLLSSYVLWVLNEAHKKGIKRLYFVSREAELLLPIAQKLIKNLGYDIELRYFYGSRQACNTPTFVNMGPEEREILLGGSDILLDDYLLARSEIDVNEVRHLIDKCRFEKHDGTIYLIGERNKKAIVEFTKSPEFLNRLQRYAERHRKSFIAYLKQEGFFENISMGYVDAGWGGSIQHSIEKTLIQEGKDPLLSGFYLGLKREKNRLPGKKESFLFDDSRLDEEGYQRFHNEMVYIIEAFLSGTEAQTLNYIQKDGEVSPILKKGHNESVQWGLKLHQKAVLNFVDQLSSDFYQILQSDQINLRQLSSDLISSFYFKPTVKEADVWGNFPFEEGQFSSRCYPLARPYSFKEFLKCVLTGQKMKHLGDHWSEASDQMTRPLIRYALDFLVKRKFMQGQSNRYFEWGYTDGQLWSKLKNRFKRKKVQRQIIVNRPLRKKIKHAFRNFYRRRRHEVRTIEHRMRAVISPLYNQRFIDLGCLIGLGDALMMTTVVREIKKRKPKAIIHVSTPHTSVFDRNPDVDFVTYYPSDHDEETRNRLEPELLSYLKFFPWKKHLINYSCSVVGIQDEIQLKTYMFPTDEDKKWVSEIVSKFDNKAPVLVNRHPGPVQEQKKTWPYEYWKILLSKLIENHVIIDIGLADGEQMPMNHKNWLDLRGKTTLHQLAALMQKSKLLICPISGALHMAAHCDLKTLVIAGGSQPGVGIRYPSMQVLESRPECFNCFSDGPFCEYDSKCLWDIKPDHVYEEVIEMMTEVTLT